MLACAGLFALSAAAQTGQIGYKAAKDADSKKTLLLKNFHPQPMLQVPAHEIKRAKFPVIDAHTRTNDAIGVGGPRRSGEIRREGGSGQYKDDRRSGRPVGDKLQGVIDQMVKPYPGRFVVFTQMDWSTIDDPNFSQFMVKQVDDSVRRTSMTRNLVR